MRMDKENIIMAVPVNFNDSVNIYDKKKGDLIRKRIKVMIGNFQHDLNDMDGDYKRMYIDTLLINLFVRLGAVEIDKKTFMASLEVYYDQLQIIRDNVQMID